MRKTIEFIKSELINLFILVIPFIIIAIFWGKLPEKIPMHWDFSGNVDTYYNKEIGIIIIPLFNILIYLLFLALPHIDPRGSNYKLFGKTYKILRFSINGLLLFIFMLIILSSLGYELNIGSIVINSTVLLFLIFGNFLGKIKSNYFIGIRTPWTLENPEIWSKTHRLGGKIWVWSSLFMLVIAFFLNIKILIIVYFVYIGIILIIPTVYSYVLHKRGV